MRPALDPANMRRQSTGYKIRRTITRWTVAYTVTATLALLFVWLCDPALNPFI